MIKACILQELQLLRFVLLKDNEDRSSHTYFLTFQYFGTQIGNSVNTLTLQFDFPRGWHG
jgi:hypothetical protein